MKIPITAKVTKPTEISVVHQKFVEVNKVTFKDNPSMLEVIDALTPELMIVETQTALGDVQAKARIRSTELNIDSVEFNQTWDMEDFFSHVDESQIINTLPDMDALHHTSKPGMYIVGGKYMIGISRSTGDAPRDAKDILERFCNFSLERTRYVQKEGFNYLGTVYIKGLALQGQIDWLVPYLSITDQ